MPATPWFVVLATSSVVRLIDTHPHTQTHTNTHAHTHTHMLSLYPKAFNFFHRGLKLPHFFVQTQNVLCGKGRHGIPSQKLHRETKKSGSPIGSLIFTLLL